jgi:hypothetical protein
VGFGRWGSEVEVVAVRCRGSGEGVLVVSLSFGGSSVFLLLPCGFGRRSQTHESPTGFRRGFGATPNFGVRLATLRLVLKHRCTLGLSR